MYHALLTNRYLTSRVIPLVAVAAVALCVALVIIVVSVMTGFLDMVKSSGRTLMGDVVVSCPISGIPYYDRLIDHIRELPEAAAVTPVVDSWGLLRMPYPEGESKALETVQIWGIDAETFTEVTGYGDTLYWRPVEEAELPEMRENDARQIIGNERLDAMFADGRNLTNRKSDLDPIVLGMHVSIGNKRQRDGSYEPEGAGRWWMPQYPVTLMTIPVVGGGFTEPRRLELQVANEFISGVFLIDKTRVMVPLAIAQYLTGLQKGKRVDPEDPDIVLGDDPARATMVLVRAAEGKSPDDLRKAVEAAYHAFSAEILLDETAIIDPPILGMRLTIKTWVEQQKEFIAPIEKERELMRTLFSLVYLVCAGLVLAIFWAIVYEKTRDIGILRSVGASRMGISWIFLRYGFVIGIFGAIAGYGLGTLIVRKINVIHDALGDPPVELAIVVFSLGLVSLVLTIIRSLSGRLLPLVLGSIVTLTLVGCGIVIVLVKQIGGVVIWDPSVYYFTEIPNEVDHQSAVYTMVGAVIFSLLGAFLPAAKAADTDPVKALRYE